MQSPNQNHTQLAKISVPFAITAPSQLQPLWSLFLKPRPQKGGMTEGSSEDSVGTDFSGTLTFLSKMKKITRDDSSSLR